MSGEICIFTGEGKGKTTAALGVAVRATLNKRRVAVIQFLKGNGYTGELFAAQQLYPHLEMFQFGHGCDIAKQIRSGELVCRKCGVCFRENRNPANHYAKRAWSCAEKALINDNIDVLVLDEISHAIRRGLIDIAIVLEKLSSRRTEMDVILTGRYMPDELIAVADSVTEMCAVRHPMGRGIDARRGIEY